MASRPRANMSPVWRISPPTLFVTGFVIAAIQDPPNPEARPGGGPDDASAVVRRFSLAKPDAVTLSHPITAVTGATTRRPGLGSASTGRNGVGDPVAPEAIISL